MSEVFYEKQGHVVHIKLMRRDRLNTMSRSMARKLAEIQLGFREDSDLWAAVFERKWEIIGMAEELFNNIPLAQRAMKEVHSRILDKDYARVFDFDGIYCDSCVQF